MGLALVMFFELLEMFWEILLAVWKYFNKPKKEREIEKDDQAWPESS